MEEYITCYTSPIGVLEIKGTESYISAIRYVLNKKDESMQLPKIIAQAKSELEAYFSGDLRDFTFPIQQTGTPFQQSVWEKLLEIDYGNTSSYLDLAHAINNPKSIRAVGTTNGKNQLAIVVPCHRVIGSNGKLVGYAGELWRKQWLLDHERKHAHGIRTLFDV